MSETHFRFRSSDKFGFLLQMGRFNPDTDGVRVHDDGNLSIAMGRRILSTTAENINGIELVDGLLWPLTLGVRRLPGSRKITFATDSGAGVRISFREAVRPAAGIVWHEEAIATIEQPTELLPAVLAARRSAEDNARPQET